MDHCEYIGFLRGVFNEIAVSDDGVNCSWREIEEVSCLPQMTEDVGERVESFRRRLPQHLINALPPSRAIDKMPSLAVATPEEPQSETQLSLDCCPPPSWEVSMESLDPLASEETEAASRDYEPRRMGGQADVARNSPAVWRDGQSMQTTLPQRRRQPVPRPPPWKAGGASDSTQGYWAPADARPRTPSCAPSGARAFSASRDGGEAYRRNNMADLADFGGGYQAPRPQSQPAGMRRSVGSVLPSTPLSMPPLQNMMDMMAPPLPMEEAPLAPPTPRVPKTPATAEPALVKALIRMRAFERAQLRETSGRPTTGRPQGLGKVTLTVGWDGDKGPRAVGRHDSLRDLSLGHMASSRAPARGPSPTEKARARTAVGMARPAPGEAVGLFGAASDVGLASAGADHLLSGRMRTTSKGLSLSHSQSMPGILPRGLQPAGLGLPEVSTSMSSLAMGRIVGRAGEPDVIRIVSGVMRPDTSPAMSMGKLPLASPLARSRSVNQLAAPVQEIHFSFDAEHSPDRSGRRSREGKAASIYQGGWLPASRGLSGFTPLPQHLVHHRAVRTRRHHPIPRPFTTMN